VLPGDSFEDRRDAAVLMVFLATGIRVSELVAIRYCAGTRTVSGTISATRGWTVAGPRGT
jgi:site-specific recombinase XerD